MRAEKNAWLNNTAEQYEIKLSLSQSHTIHCANYVFRNAPTTHVNLHAATLSMLHIQVSVGYVDLVCFRLSDSICACFALGSQCQLLCFRLSVYICCTCFLFHSSPTTAHVNLCGFGHISLGLYLDDSANYVSIFCFCVSASISCKSSCRPCPEMRGHGASFNPFTYEHQIVLFVYGNRFL